MNKSETISNLKFFLAQYQQWSATCNKINSLNLKLTQYAVPPKILDKMSKKEYKRLKKEHADDISFCCFIIICAAAILFELLKAIFPIPFAEIYKLAENIGSINAILGLLIAAYLIITFILAPKAAKSDRDKYNQNVERKNEKNQREFQEHQRQIPSIQAEINCLLTLEKGQKAQVLQSAKICGLHADYQNLDTVKKLIYLLESGRCDTLKEALNMYEKEARELRREMAEDAHHRAMEKAALQQAAQLDAIQQEAVRQADAAERAAKSADDAAFWGTVAAYEADKINRKLDK